MKKSIAITKGDQDLIRIIPFNIIDSMCEFKIALLNNNFTLRLKPINTPYFWNLETDITDYEITYHRSNKNDPTKLHFKNIKKEEDYKTFPLNHLLDPTMNTDFPFPLLKLGVSPQDKFKKFKPNEKYAQLALEEHNVVELFIINKDFDSKFFLEKWSLFSYLLTILPIEYYTNGKVGLESI